MNRHEKRRQLKAQANMDKEYTIKLTQREIICICNALGVSDDGSPRQYRIGDGYILFNVLTQLQPLAAIATNIPEDQQGKQPPPELPKEEPAFEIDEKPAIIGTDADGAKEDKAN